MSGSAQVIANMAGWQTVVLKSLEAELARHIKKSEEYAKASGRWIDRTSDARQGLTGSAPYQEGVYLMVSVYHSEKYGEWLERRLDFYGAHRILEMARSHNLALLWARCQAILSGRGMGFSVTGAG